MTRHPAEFWIKFLLSRREHSFEEIVAMCEAIDVGPVNTQYVAALDSDLRQNMPTPFRGFDRQHLVSTVFLRQQGILEAWRKTSHMREAIELLGNSKIRAPLETFILAPMKQDHVIRKISSLTGIDIEPQTYELFRHYFWNPDLLSAEEWGEYVAERRVAHKDWLRVAITAQGPQGVQLVLWKTGSGSIRHMESSKMFTHLRNIAYLKALELEHAPAGRDNSMAFRNYVQSAKMANEEATASAAAMTDILDSFQAFKMRTVEDTPPSIKQLVGDGSFSEPEDNTVTEDKIRMEDY